MGWNPLPVELIDFTAECEQDAVLISWKTLSEKNNHYFSLERSFDAKNWIAVARVEGSGTTNSPKNYSVLDKLKTNEVVYYRLNQVDYDARQEFYPALTTNCLNGEEALFVYPNPATDELTLECNILKNRSNAFIKIIDNMGRVCQHQPVVLNKGSNSVKLILSLPAGTYTILLFSNEFVFPAKRIVVR